MIAPLPTAPPVADIELSLLLEAVYRVCGYDFRDYTWTFVKRRVSERMRAEGVPTISALQDRLLHDGEALDRFIYGVTCRSSKLFDEPGFFAELQATALPMLRTFPVVRVWIAGCGRGEDAYALAILLKEAGISARARLYATDISATAIVAAKEGRIDGEPLDALSRRYREAGGSGNLEDYILMHQETMRVHRSLLANVVFSTHNLVCDGSFNEFHLIVCRDVLTQFNKSLAFRAHQVFFESLARGGFLAMGSAESIGFSPHHRCFERASDSEQIHRRVR